jgi:hypothetical protein
MSTHLGLHTLQGTRQKESRSITWETASNTDATILSWHAPCRFFSSLVFDTNAPIVSHGALEELHDLRLG